MKAHSRKTRVLFYSTTALIALAAAFAGAVLPASPQGEVAPPDQPGATSVERTPGPGDPLAQEAAANEQLAARARKRFEEIIRKRDVKLSPEEQRSLARTFHSLQIWQSMWFQGIPIQKNPCDLWMMQQIIFEVRPELIVETGTAAGGSALYWADCLDDLGLTASRVVTMDIEDHTADVSRRSLWQKYVTFFRTSSTDPKTAAEVRRMAEGKQRVLVVLDALHTKDHVLEELKLYAPMVTVGSYVVVEDTNIDGVPVGSPSFGPGPMAAVTAFLEQGGSEHFVQDLSREAMVLTFNPGGWLRRTN